MDATPTLERGWPGPGTMRIALGCMRMSTDADADDAAAVATIESAAAAGITVFDTAHAYGPGEQGMGHNERLLARALRGCDAHGGARIVTKGGMSRREAGWVPDGRARAILAGCEASLAALDGLDIDVYLLHAPDPRTPWTTSVRALRRLLDEGMVRRVGVSNVNRAQLDQALDIVGVSAIQVALSVVDTRAVRGGLVERCEERDIAFMAHSPLGGVRRARTLARQSTLLAVAAEHGATVHEVALAWLVQLSRTIVPVVGARRPATARSAARAASLVLSAAEQQTLARTFDAARPTAAPHRTAVEGEVIVVMGIPGAGKERIALEYAARGHARLNRDASGGSLRDIAAALDEALGAGCRHAVLDNTYLTRASRSHVIDAARRHGVLVRCIWMDTPLAQAQVNVVLRFLDRIGRLPEPGEIRTLSRFEPGLLSPASHMRTQRELEPPSMDEGFDSVERRAFARASADGGAGVIVAAAAAAGGHVADALRACDPAAPHLVFDWSPDGARAQLDIAASRVTAVVSGAVEASLCAHAPGPPVCWCRPPLPGLPLAFARRHGVDVARCAVIGAAAAHRTLAGALDARYVPVPVAAAS